MVKRETITVKGASINLDNAQWRGSNRTSRRGRWISPGVQHPGYFARVSVGEREERAALRGRGPWR